MTTPPMRREPVTNGEPPRRGPARDGYPTRRRLPDSVEIGESAAERRRRRAAFLAELAEARALRERVAPRRARTARLRAALRMRTFRV
jgi:hypothetical protein